MNSLLTRADQGVGTAGLDPSLPWDEFTTISEPQMMANMNAAKSQMMNIPPNMWNQPIAPLPSNSSLPGTPSVPSQTHTPMHAPPGYAMHPDGTVWPVQSTRSMTLPAQPEMGSPYTAQFPHGVPDLKRSMTSPAQSHFGGPVGSQSPPSGELQASPMPMSPAYPAQQTMDLSPQYQAEMGGMSPINVVPYQMYPGQPGFPSHHPPPPMRQSSHGHAPGHGHGPKTSKP